MTFANEIATRVDDEARYALIATLRAFEITRNDVLTVIAMLQRMSGEFANSEVTYDVNPPADLSDDEIESVLLELLVQGEIAELEE